jgi:pyruvate dehydrogenase E1 component alpha subunit
MLGGRAIVGRHIRWRPAWRSRQVEGRPQVVLCFFGEAAVNIGAFHESLNMAALWKLPCIYIVENNRYGMGTAIERASAIYDIAARARAYDMASETVDGMDVLAVREVVGRAWILCRMPTLIRRALPLHGPRCPTPCTGTTAREEVDGRS